jgi:hypothetical protein
MDAAPDASPDTYVDPTIGPLGTACSPEGALSCADHAQATVVRCVGGVWTAQMTCPDTQRCDTEAGPNHGTCQDVATGCAGLTPNASVCTGADRLLCGPDLVTSTTMTCISNAACLASTGPTCAECGDANDCTQLGAVAGAPYNHRVVASGGAGPYTFLVSGVLPAGITLTPSGELIGVPEGSGSTFTVNAVDANECVGSYTYALDVSGTGCIPATLGPDKPFLTGTIGVAFTTAADPFTTGAPATIAAIGTLPPGIALVADHLEGMPTLAGDYTFVISATNASGCAATRSYSMHVNRDPHCDVAVSVPSLPAGIVGQLYEDYSHLFPLAGHGTGTYVFEMSGLPPGLVYQNNLIIGVPTTAGTYQVQIKVTDGLGCSAPAATVMLSIVQETCSALTVSPAPDGVIVGAQGQTLTGTFAASGGTPPYGFGAVYAPYNLTMTSDGMLSGVLAGPRLYSAFVVVVQDANGCEGSVQDPILITPATCPAIDVAPGVGACEQVSCNAGSCGGAPLPDGTLVSNDIQSDCAQSTCLGGVATRIFDAAENCGPATTCIGLDTCSGQTGAACDVDGGPSFLSAQTSTFCDTGTCRDGVCCTSDCNGTCETCSGTGVCHPQVDAFDPDTCTGEQMCDSTSACKKVMGAPCTTSDDCIGNPEVSCVPSYVDADQDIWGDSAQPAGLRCINYNHVGFGYTDRGGDCCDTDVHAFPGFDQYDDVAPYSQYPDACGSYDRNCDSTLEYYTPVGVPTCTPGGNETFIQYFPSFVACGDYAQMATEDCDGSCHCTSSLGAYLPQECR